MLLVVGLAAVGAVTAVPRFRRRAIDKLKPQVDGGPDQPARAGRRSRPSWCACSAAPSSSQVLFALVLGASLHAYGASASLGELIVINTLASLLGRHRPGARAAWA